MATQCNRCYSDSSSRLYVRQVSSAPRYISTRPLLNGLCIELNQCIRHKPFWDSSVARLQILWRHCLDTKNLRAPEYEQNYLSIVQLRHHSTDLTKSSRLNRLSKRNLWTDLDRLVTLLSRVPRCQHISFNIAHLLSGKSIRPGRCKSTLCNLLAHFF